MKKISAIVAACFAGVVVVQAQTVIDALNGTSGDLSAFTTTLLLDNSHGVNGISFSDSSGFLTASYVATGTSAEQAVFLAPASSFSSLFTVGDTLFVDTSVPASTTQMDFGLVIAATTTPTAASSGNGWDARGTFDWASISLRPSQSAVRVNVSTNGSPINTGSAVAGVGTTANISELFITWNSPLQFSLGYVSNGVQVVDSTVTFNSGSTIGTAIGFYGDLRATGSSLGNFSNLSIQPAPEPSTVAFLGMGVACLAWLRRKF